MSSFVNFKNILVVGVGLIGGSIIRALKEISFSGGVYGIDSDESAVTSAYDIGLVRNKFMPSTTCFCPKIHPMRIVNRVASPRKNHCTNLSQRFNRNIMA